MVWKGVRNKSRWRRGRSLEFLQKPGGVVHPRVQEVGPERFAVVSVDCAKARSKWMLADFYGKVLIPPTFVGHNRVELEAAVARVRAAMQEHDLRDLLVAVERTGRYHHPVLNVFAAAGFARRGCRAAPAGRSSILDKLLAFHSEHETPIEAMMRDLHQAAAQVPPKEHAAEAQPLQQRLERQRRRKGPQPLVEALAIVLARLGVGRIQSTASGEKDLA